MDELLASYSDAIDKYESAAKPKLAEVLLHVLLLRDQIAASLTVEKIPLPDDRARVGTSLQIHDERLQKLAPEYIPSMSSDTFSKWRDLYQPPPSTWWWFLDQSVSTAQDKRNAVWLVLTGFVVALTIAYATDIVTRYLSGGPDAMGVLYIASQVFFTFLAGSAFTEAGRQWIKNLFSIIRLPHRWQPGISFVMALSVLGGIFWFRQSLPERSEEYHQQGHSYLDRDHISHAIENYKRAIALDPDNEAAHYDLADAYEAVFDYDKAISEYQRVIELNGTYDTANNNLARLYILKSNDFDRALGLVNKVFDNGSIENKEPSIQYSAYKNRGWAYWGLKLPRAAKENLEKALQAENGAEANALLARLLDEMAIKLGSQELKDKAKTYWLTASKLHKQNQIDIRNNKQVAKDVIDAQLVALADEQARIIEGK